MLKNQQKNFKSTKVAKFFLKFTYKTINFQILQMIYIFESFFKEPYAGLLATVIFSLHVLFYLNSLVLKSFL